MLKEILTDGEVALRAFEASDVGKKVEWINDPENNTYLHYDLPLEYEKTLQWYERVKDSETRLDLTILYNGEPVGVIGLLSIDKRNGKAEYYITLGAPEAKGRGVASKASSLLLDYAFDVLGLNRVYLFTESENTRAQKLFSRVGFVSEGLFRDDLFSRGRYVDRLAYSVIAKDRVKGTEK